MKERSGYQPAPGELAAAESMLTPEQRAASEVREKFKQQERPAFFDSAEKFTDKMERKPPTPEQRRQIEAELGKLGDLFAGSDVRWQLDGAINISLMAGDFIGAHKDVDISIDQADLSKLDGILDKKGYGLFISRLKDEKQPGGDRVMERRGASGLSGEPAEHVMLAAVDAQGKLRGGEELDYVDVHVVRRDAAGKPVGPFGASLPERWYEPQKIEHNGRELKISQPELVAYFKIREGRAYDLNDLRHLVEAGRLPKEKIEEVGSVIENDMNARRQMVDGMTGDVLAGLGEEQDPGKIVEAFAAHPRVAGRITEKDDPQLSQLRDVLAGLGKIDRAQFTEAVVKVFRLTDYEDEQRQKIQKLLNWSREHEDRERVARAREDIEHL